MDVKALLLLKERKEYLEKVIEQSDNEILETIRQNGSETANKKTVACITKVNKYSVNIKEAMEELKSKVKEYHMKIGQIMKKLSEDIVIVDAPRRKGPIPEQLKLIKEMQKISQQQNELLKIMTETQQVLISVENDGDEAISLLKDLKSHIDQYAKSIETDEKRKQREKEEDEIERKKQEAERQRQEVERQRQEKMRQEEEERRRKEEEERRRREEEERKRKEEEERLNEEKRLAELRKQEEENKRMEKERRKNMEEMKRFNPDNWPVHRYERKDGDMNSFHRKICCIAWAIEEPNGFSKNDVHCSVKDHEDYTCLQMGEYLQSDVIHIACNEKDKMSLQVNILD